MLSCVLRLAILIVAVLMMLGVPHPSTAHAITYKKCKPVTVNFGVIKAEVWVRRTKSRELPTCKFGRIFVRKNRFRICDIKPVRGWRKGVSGRGENIIITLIKGSKRIRTDACGASRKAFPGPLNTSNP